VALSVLYRAVRAAAATAVSLTVTALHAAGGHHTVDDAMLLDSGQCQLETWFERGNGGAGTLLHVEPGCRVGAVELALSLERSRADRSTLTLAGLQLKWARALGEGWSAGIVLAGAAGDREPRWRGSTVLLPLTWQATDSVLAHLNIGRDFRHREADSARHGIALEWLASGSWSFVGERFDEGGAGFWRAGARWSVTPALQVDLSRARALAGGAGRWWTLGLSWSFER
jgi:hypothetical protein